MRHNKHLKSCYAINKQSDSIANKTFLWLWERTRYIDHSFTMNQCVIKKLKLDLKNGKTEAARYMQSSFDEMLERFLNWLSSAVWYKPNRLKKILSENLPNWLNSAKLPPLCGSFRRAPPKIKNIYYQDTKEKDQKIFPHMACFCHTGLTFEQH